MARLVPIWATLEVARLVWRGGPMDGYLRRRSVKLSRTDQSIEVGVLERYSGQLRVPSGPRGRRTELCLGTTSHRNRPRYANPPGECLPDRPAGVSGHSVREPAGAWQNPPRCCSTSTDHHRTSSSITTYKLKIEYIGLGMHLHLWTSHRPRMEACPGGRISARATRARGSSGNPRSLRRLMALCAFRSPR
jgi:hypothetical protein